MQEYGKKFDFQRKETTYNDIKAVHKGCSIDFNSSRKRRKTYTILNRAVTPLILANERVVESLMQIAEDVALKIEEVPIEAKMEKLSIQELMPDLQLQRKPSKSVNVKRSYLEMSRLRSVLSDVFSIASLKAIFSYVDYESLRFPTPHFVVIGHFASIVFQVILIYEKILIDWVSRTKKNFRLCSLRNG